MKDFHQSTRLDVLHNIYVQRKYICLGGNITKLDFLMFEDSLLAVNHLISVYLDVVKRAVG